MRCKVGDLAICVRNPQLPENVGMLFHIDRFFAAPDFWEVTALSAGRGVDIKRNRGVQDFSAGSSGYMPDSYLRPLRDGPGADETLRDAPAPEPDPINTEVEEYAL